MFGRRIYVVVPVGLLAVIALGFGIATLRPDQLGQAAAGWSQALGAIGAIGVAIWIAHSQHREAQRSELVRRIQSTESLFESAIALGVAAQHSLDAVEEELRIAPNEFWGYRLTVEHDHIAWLTTRVESLPLQDFGDPRAVDHVIRLRHALSEYSTRAPKRGLPPNFSLNVPGARTVIFNETDQLKLILQELRAKHGVAQ